MRPVVKNVKRDARSVQMLAIVAQSMHAKLDGITAQKVMRFETKRTCDICSLESAKNLSKESSEGRPRIMESSHTSASQPGGGTGGGSGERVRATQRRCRGVVDVGCIPGTAQGLASRILQ